MSNETLVLDNQKKPSPKPKDQEKSQEDAFTRYALETVRLRKALIDNFTKEILKEFNNPDNKEFIKKESEGYLRLRTKSSDGTFVELGMVMKAGKPVVLDIFRLFADGSYSRLSHNAIHDMLIFDQWSSDPKKERDTTIRAAHTVLPSMMKDFRAGIKQKIP